MMWGIGGLGYLWMLMAWITIAAAVVWGLRAPQRDRRQHHAVEILNERFARGEVDRTEYETRRAELTR